MKILHIIFSMNIGGAETMLVDILNQQVKYNHTLELIIINNEYNTKLLETIDPRVKIKCFNRKKGSKNIIPILKYNCYISNSKADILHFHEHTAIECLFIKKHHRVLTIHDVSIPIKKPIDCDIVCSISNAVKNDLYNRLGIDSTLVYNGINFEDIKISQGDKITNTTNTIRILQISRLDHLKKGQDILIKAISTIKKQYPLYDISLDLIGDGESLPYLQKLVSENNLDKTVNFLGTKDRKYVYSHLCEYDILVQPSIYEGFGLTVVEGLAAKIPVLVSDIDGPMEIIEKGKYGYFFRSGDTEDCAAKIIQIINSPDLTTSVVEAYDYAKQNFSIQNTAKRYLQLYNEVLSK
ncbi:MAG: glycosyltransferase family 4 protein [Dysgonomonas sp.]